MEANESKNKVIKKEEEERKCKRAIEYEDPMGKAKEVIRESLLITPPNKQQNETERGHVAQHPDDILAFSRSVNTTDSSLH
ncbi:hypothetical protein AgCh_028400 [Apium graveolens]